MSSLRMSLLVVFSENGVGGKGREGLEKSLNRDPGTPEREQERESRKRKKWEERGKMNNNRYYCNKISLSNYINMYIFLPPSPSSSSLPLFLFILFSSSSFLTR